MIIVGHRPRQERIESLCPACDANADGKGLKAPKDWYRCPACGTATPRHKLRTKRRVDLMGGPLGQATLLHPYRRFYLPREVDSHLVCAFDSNWDDVSSASGNRWQLRTTRANSPMGVEAFSNPLTANTQCLWAQFISETIVGQTISGTVKGQIRCAQSFVEQAFDQVVVSIRAVSGDCSQVRGTLLTLASYGTTNLFSVPLDPYQNRKIADGDALNPVGIVTGDRIVVEIGAQASTTPSANDFVACILGDNAVTDLSEDEIDIGEDNPWIEFTH